MRQILLTLTASVCAVLLAIVLLNRELLDDSRSAPAGLDALGGVARGASRRLARRERDLRRGARREHAAPRRAVARGVCAREAARAVSAERRRGIRARGTLSLVRAGAARSRAGARTPRRR